MPFEYQYETRKVSGHKLEEILVRPFEVYSIGSQRVYKLTQDKLLTEAILQPLKLHINTPRRPKVQKH
jgi:hypothetical protein